MREEDVFEKWPVVCYNWSMGKNNHILGWSVVVIPIIINIKCIMYYKFNIISLKYPHAMGRYCYYSPFIDCETEFPSDWLFCPGSQLVSDSK